MNNNTDRTTLALMLGIGANALWGAAFIIPYVLHDFSSELISISRYAIYGVISIATFPLLKRGAKGISMRIFLIGNLISFCGNLGYYLFLTIGIKNSGFVYPALIIGLLPVSVILIGNFQSREVLPARLLPGVGLIAAGILVVNSLSLESAAGGAADTNHLFGIGVSLIALLLLTIYCIVNANFLKSNPHISSSRWAATLGICALLHSILFAVITFLVDGRNVLAMHHVPGDRLLAFALGALFLGVCVSYLAMWMWNVSSRSISSVTAGRVLCLETIFALAYGYAIDFRIPQLTELLGICLVILGAYLVQQRADSQRQAEAVT